MEKPTDVEATTFQKFLILFIIGFFLIFIGVAIVILTSLLHGEGSVNFGGVIFIWFIPIAFGVGPEALWMVLFAMILAVLSIIMVLILHRRTELEKA